MRRVRAKTALALLAAALALGAVAALGQDYRLQDFDCFRTAAALAIEGRDPYDPAVWATAPGAPPDPAGTARRTSCLGSRFAYPLWTALAFAPLALVPYPATAALWLALSAAAVLGAALLVLRAAAGGRAAILLAVVVATSQPFALTIMSGQLSAIVAALLAATALALGAKRDRSAGVLLGATLLKPQLVIATLPAVALWAWRARRRGLLLALAATAGALGAASLAARPGWPGPWLAEVAGPRLAVAPLLPSVWGLSADLTGGPVAGALLAGALVALLARHREDAPLRLIALGSAVSLAVAPHVWSYDHLALAPAWALLAADGDRCGGRARLARLLVLVGCATLLPWLLYAVALARGTEAWSVLVPLATAAALLARPRDR